MLKKCFFEKKRFHLFRSLLKKNVKAQDMPLVAGRLVDLLVDCHARMNEKLTLHFKKNVCPIMKLFHLAINKGYIKTYELIHQTDMNTSMYLYFLLLCYGRKFLTIENVEKDAIHT